MPPRTCTYLRVVLASVLVCALLAGAAGCGKSEEDSRNDVTSSIANDMGMSEEAVDAILQSADGAVKPTDPAKGWVRGLDGYWMGPRRDGFSPNVNVYSFATRDDPTAGAEDFMLQSDGMNQSLLNQYKKINDGPSRFQGRPAFRLEYTGRVGEHTLRGRQIFVEVDGYVYALTATTRRDRWTKDRAAVEQTMNSYDLTNRDE